MSDATAPKTEPEELLKLTSEIVAAYVSNNTVPTDSLDGVIKSVYSTLMELGSPNEGATPVKPAVPIRKSYTDDYIICLEDGKKLKMLKRYLRSHYGLSPDEYRAKWKLPADYPMVAPAYASKRSEFAKKIGLGKKK